MAISTDLGSWPFSSKNLDPMTVETSSVFRKIGDVGKSFIAFADFFPVFRGKLMTRVASEFLLIDMRLVRKTAVVDLGYGRRPNWPSALGDLLCTCS